MVFLMKKDEGEKEDLRNNRKFTLREKYYHDRNTKYGKAGRIDVCGCFGLRLQRRDDNPGKRLKIHKRIKTSICEKEYKNGFIDYELSLPILQINAVKYGAKYMTSICSSDSFKTKIMY